MGILFKYIAFNNDVTWHVAKEFKYEMQRRRRRTGVGFAKQRVHTWLKALRGL